MSANRRNFLRNLTGVAAWLSVSPFWETLQGQNLLDEFERQTIVDLDESVRDEHFWHQIKQSYTVSPSIINLNNGGVSPQPKVVQDAVERYNKLSNETPSYYMWRILNQGKEPLREKLSELAGCSAEELAINRNASEALETIIFGLRLKAGDEIVLSKYDYPNMINAWKQRQHREGIVLKWADFSLPSNDEAALAQAYIDAFSPKTKVVHITHMINWCGQVLPVKKIAEAARERGIEVLVDGAHTFAHLDYNIPDLGCDYWGTSLHKWLCAPFGSGMLYVKKEKIKDLYPLFAGDNPESDNIRKFENLGTRSYAIEQAIGQAVDFHWMIGSERKEKRLHFLKNYWIDKVKHLSGFQLTTPSASTFSGAIALVGLEQIKPKEFSSRLFKEYKIHTSPVEWEDLKGVRITPNVYTLTRDLDRLVKAFHEMAS